MSSWSSWSESIDIMTVAVMLMSSAFISVSGFSSFSLGMDKWNSSISFPDLQGWWFLKQLIMSSSDPYLIYKSSAHVLKNFLMTPTIIYFHASTIQLITTRRGGGFRFPPENSWLTSSFASHLSYFSVAHINFLCMKWKYDTFFHVAFIRIPN